MLCIYIYIHYFPRLPYIRTKHFCSLISRIINYMNASFSLSTDLTLRLAMDPKLLACKGVFTGKVLHISSDSCCLIFFVPADFKVSSKSHVAFTSNADNLARVTVTTAFTTVLYRRRNSLQTLGSGRFSWYYHN